jgi:hypothetical protein
MNGLYRVNRRLTAQEILDAPPPDNQPWYKVQDFFNTKPPEENPQDPPIMENHPNTIDALRALSLVLLREEGVRCSLTGGECGGYSPPVEGWQAKPDGVVAP